MLLNCPFSAGKIIKSPLSENFLFIHSFSYEKASNHNYCKRKRGILLINRKDNQHFKKLKLKLLLKMLENLHSSQV